MACRPCRVVPATCFRSIQQIEPGKKWWKICANQQNLSKSTEGCAAQTLAYLWRILTWSLVLLPCHENTVRLLTSYLLRSPLRLQCATFHWLPARRWSQGCDPPLVSSPGPDPLGLTAALGLWLEKRHRDLRYLRAVLLPQVISFSSSRHRRFTHISPGWGWCLCSCISPAVWTSVDG